MIAILATSVQILIASLQLKSVGCIIRTHKEQEGIITVYGS